MDRVTLILPSALLEGDRERAIRAIIQEMARRVKSAHLLKIFSSTDPDVTIEWAAESEIPLERRIAATTFATTIFTQWWGEYRQVIVNFSVKM